MAQMRLVVSMLLCICCCSFRSAVATPSDNQQKLVVILLDGFRWDYIEQHKLNSLPGFRRMQEEGVRAQWVSAVFPSLSYTSWTTLSTGLNAENHNIIGNFFYDSNARNKFELFNRTSTSLMRWWEAEPIWTTATKHRRKVASFLWARSDIPLQGVRIQHPQGFGKTNGPNIFASNLDDTVRMLKNGYDLVMLYSEHIDNKGHQFGPTSAEVKRAVKEIDYHLDRFLTMLEQHQLNETVNVMIVSGYGMASGGAQSGVIYTEMDDYIDLDDVLLVIGRTTLAAVAPLPGKLEKVYNQLKRMPGVDVYRRDDIPDHYHYKNGRYVQQILVVARPGYIIRGGSDYRHLPRDPPDLVWNGYHGHDENHPDMRTIFMAKGPSFKTNYIGPPIALVDIYQLYAHILAVPAQAHNGTWSRVESYLKHNSASSALKHFQLGPIAALVITGLHFVL